MLTLNKYFVTAIVLYCIRVSRSGWSTFICVWINKFEMNARVRFTWYLWTRARLYKIYSCNDYISPSICSLLFDKNLYGLTLFFNWQVTSKMNLISVVADFKMLLLLRLNFITERHIANDDIIEIVCTSLGEFKLDWVHVSVSHSVYHFYEILSKYRKIHNSLVCVSLNSCLKTLQFRWHITKPFNRTIVT